MQDAFELVDPSNNKQEAYADIGAREQRYLAWMMINHCILN